MSNNTSFENDVAYDPDMVRAMNLSRAQALAQKQNHQQHLIVNMSRYVLHNAAKTFLNRQIVSRYLIYFDYSIVKDINADFTIGN